MTTATPRYPAPYPPNYRPSASPMVWLGRLLILTLTGMLLLGMILVALVFAFQTSYSQRIYPNVYAMGVPVGGMTEAEALAALSAAPSSQGGVFTLRAGERVWQVTSAELGVQFDVQATLAQAFAIGRAGHMGGNLVQQAQAWLSGVNVPPFVSYDEGKALSALQNIAQEINRPAQNARLLIEGANVSALPAEMGRELDVSASLARLNERINALQWGGELDLLIRESQPQVLSAESAAEQVRVALSAPITLTATDALGGQLGPWTVNPEQIAQLLRVERVAQADGTLSYQVSVDMSAFSASLAALAPGLIAASKDGRFDFDDSTLSLRVLEPAQSGRQLNVPETLKRLQEAVFMRDGRIVPLAFDLTLPRYHNQISAAELGIRELVAESTTYFTGSSASRRTNIAVSASRFNGVIIAPNEEFSFNTILGPIEEEAGFENSLVIYGGRTIEGVGGGACQVSTTIFRAAFTGGFAITERNSHGYRVGYYELRGAPPGLDAAIWQPERDFKFQNNTPYHLLIETTIFPNDDAIQFRFYSTKHWQAQIEAPIIKDLVPAKPTRFEVNNELQSGQMLQVDYAAEGADVTIYRNVYDLQGNLAIKDYIYTHYLPWGAIFQVPPGDPRLGS